ncbi:MAG: hypothetical protein Q4A66_11090, partial [Eubacteriales bacterium]|nr:hypothetical protein [Eubacteriales bacterium]
SVDPALKVGGEQKFVMLQSAAGVLLVRLPLTYVLGYALGWGIRGVFFANYIALGVRAVSGMIRFSRGRWIHEDS